MPEEDDFASELRGDEDVPLNAKGNDWVATIVGGLIVGIMVVVCDQWLSKDSNNNDKLVELTANVQHLTKQVDKLTEQPYVRRDEYKQDISAIEGRLSGFDERVLRLEGRATPVREADRRR